MSHTDQETTGSEDPASSRLSSTSSAASPRGWLGFFKRKRSDEELRETIEELIGESDQGSHDDPTSEGHLLNNVLHLHDLKVRDVMIPRADIVAIDSDASLNDLITLMAKEGHSRLPVYRGELDDVIGMVHVKDLLPYTLRPQDFAVQQVLRDVIIVAPSMPILELLVEMRQSRRYMALVVDEFGGIDGLATMEDLVEEIVGEIEDEHDATEAPQMVLKSDGSLMADGRLPLEDLEARTGSLLEEESHDEVETLGGLLSFIAGRVPGRGELIRHDNGIEFEVIEADSRRVKRVRIRNLPTSPTTEA